MGAVLKPGRALFAALAVVAVTLAFGAALASAAGCTDTWTGSVSSNWYTAGNWSSGVPTSSSDVCINSSTVNVDGNGGSGGAHADSVTLTGSTLNIAGGTDSTLGSLEVANGGSIDSTSSIVLTELCSSACSAAGSSLTVDAGTLTNQGTIMSAAGTSSGSGRATGRRSSSSTSLLASVPRSTGANSAASPWAPRAGA